MEQTLNVKGMSCGHCVKAVEGALDEINVKARVELEQGKVYVDYDDSKVTLDDIKNAIEEQGYET